MTPLPANDVGHAAQPALVLLHGLDLAGPWWTPALDPLAVRHRVLVPDLPGFGRAHAAGPFAFERAVVGLEALLDARGVTAGHLCGESIGGAVAIAFALARPERVASLVICGAAGVSRRAGNWMARVAATLASQRQLAEAAARRVAPGGATLAQLAREQSVRLGSRGRLAALAALGHRAPTLDDLALLAVPTLVLTDASRGPCRRAARAMAAAIRGAELRSLSLPPNPCVLARPVEFAAAVADFVGAVEHRRHDEHDHMGCLICN